eukprot:942766-Pyramimonas_sp.AAC.2
MPCSPRTLGRRATTRQITANRERGRRNIPLRVGTSRRRGRENCAPWAAAPCSRGVTRESAGTPARRGPCAAPCQSPQVQGANSTVEEVNSTGMRVDDPLRELVPAQNGALPQPL